MTDLQDMGADVAPDPYFSQTEKMRLQKLRQSMSQIDQAVADGEIDNSHAAELRAQAQSMLAPLARQAAQVQRQSEDQKLNQITRLNQHQQIMDLQNRQVQAALFQNSQATTYDQQLHAQVAAEMARSNPGLPPQQLSALAMVETARRGGAKHWQQTKPGQWEQVEYRTNPSIENMPQPAEQTEEQAHRTNIGLAPEEAPMGETQQAEQPRLAPPPQAAPYMPPQDWEEADEENNAPERNDYTPEDTSSGITGGTQQADVPSRSAPPPPPLTPEEESWRRWVAAHPSRNSEMNAILAQSQPGQVPWMSRRLERQGNTDEWIIPQQGGTIRTLRGDQASREGVVGQQGGPNQLMPSGAWQRGNQRGSYIPHIWNVANSEARIRLPDGTPAEVHRLAQQISADRGGLILERRAHGDTWVPVPTEHEQRGQARRQMSEQIMKDIEKEMNAIGTDPHKYDSEEKVQAEHTRRMERRGYRADQVGNVPMPRPFNPYNRDGTLRADLDDVQRGQMEIIERGRRLTTTPEAVNLANRLRTIFTHFSSMESMRHSPELLREYNTKLARLNDILSRSGQPAASRVPATQQGAQQQRSRWDDILGPELQNLLGIGGGRRPPVTPLPAVQEPAPWTPATPQF